MTSTNKNIRRGVVITGTINPDGSIGKVAGILEKAKAVADSGYKTFLVPKGQSKINYYEKVVEKQPTVFGFTLLNTRYVRRTIDLKDVAEKEWGLDVEEVSNIDEAMQYVFE